jgi:hypothetical protein
VACPAASFSAAPSIRRPDAPRRLRSIVLVEEVPKTT